MSKKVLIAEDESIIALNLRTVLVREGYEVVATVSSGQEAFTAAIALQPDIILIDIDLAGDTDGITTATRIREQLDVPIIYLTDKVDPPTVERILATKAHAYLLKPCDEYKLRLTLEITLYKHSVDNKIRESEQWLSTTIKSIGDAVIATDEKGHIRFMNEVAEGLTGWPGSEAASRPLTEVFVIINETSRLTVENPAERVLREGKTVGLANHTILIARDGTERHIDDAAAPILDHEGNIQGVVLTFRDITEKRQAQQLLEMKERELNDFLENASIGMHRADVNGKILWANQEELDIFGCTREEYIGHHLSEFYADPQDTRILIDRLHTYNAVRNFETRIRRSDGSIRYVMINANVLWDNGKFVYTRCFTRDITDLKQTQSALRQSEEDYRGIFEHAHDAIIIFSPNDERVLDVNPGACARYGFTREEFLAISLHDISINPEHGVRKIAETLGDKSFIQFETRQYRKDGSEMILDVHATSIIYNGRPAIMSINRDITERTHFAQALSLSEERYRLIVENQTELIVRWLPDGTRTFVNESYCKYFNLKAENLIGHTFFSLIPHEDREAILHKISSLSPEQPQATAEHRNIAPDGSIRWAQWIDRGIFDHEGKLMELLSVGRDITERKNAEEAFQISEKRYRLVVENAADVIYTTDKNGYFTYANPAGLKKSGYTNEELAGLRYIDLVEPEHRARMRYLYVRQFIERRNSMYVEFPFITKTGGIEWFGQTSSLIMENDEITGFYIIGHSITDQRQAEEVLRNSRNQIRSVLESSPFPLILTDIETGTVLFINNRAAELFGITTEEAAGQFAPDYYVNSGEGRRLLAYIREHGSVQDYELMLRDRDGRPFWALLSAQVLDYNNRPALITSCNNIAARKQAEDEIRRLNATLEERVERRTRQLSRINRDKDEILALVAHDLKNPLSGIFMAAEILLRYHDRISPEALYRQSSMILEASSRMERIITNLLDINALETGTIALVPQNVQLNRILDDLLPQYVEKAAVKDITIHADIEGEPTVYADKTAVGQILDNLISNAVKFSPYGSTVSLTARANGNSVLMAIQDEGPGFKEEDMAKLFTKFARLSAKPTGGEHSTGLGLSIVKKLTEAMSGNVRCRSTPGIGTTFIVELPRQQDL